MSLILDALKKAEQDRHAGQAPVLDEMLVRRAPVAAARRRDSQQDVVILAAVVAALLFAAAGLFYWLWPAPQPAAVASTPAPVAAASTAAVLVAEPAPALRIDPERLQPPVADVPDDAIDTADTGAAQAETMDDLDGDAAPRKKAAPAVVASAPVEAAPSPAAAEPPPAPRVTTAEPAVRSLKEMPPAFRSDFPKLSVDVHVYDDNPLRRFVLINGKKYRETDTLLDGPRVVEIVPNGVIVEQRGSKVLLELPR